MHAYHLAHGATMIDDAGWQRPAFYTSPDEEAQQVREAVGLLDASPIGKLDVKGKDLTRCLNGIPEKVGQVGWMTIGTDRILCCCLTDDHARILTPAGRVETVEAELNGRITNETDCVHIINVTSVFAAVELIGPQSRALLMKLTTLDIRPDTFPNLTCAQGKVADVHSLVIRTDWNNLLTYQIHVSRDYGAYLWEVILEAGHEFGIIPVGVQVKEMMNNGEQSAVNTG